MGIQVRRLGFTALHDGDNGEPRFKLNVIFVHGLMGHPRNTWEDTNPSEQKRGHRSRISWRIRSLFGSSKSRPTTLELNQLQTRNRVFWPEEYLALDVSEARIWTYGYNADVISGIFQGNNRNSISQHGQDLAAKLEREIENDDPIIFVAHSLGGIIVKHALHRSKSWRTRTRFIVFLGTPHRGSPSANWGQIVSNIARIVLQDSNKSLLRSLEVNSEVLDNIHDEFKSIIHEGGIRIHSFQEARAITGISGLHGKIVDDFSSKLDLPAALETVETIDGNLRQIARCHSKDDPRYGAILGVLQHFIWAGMDGKDATPASVVASTLFMLPFQRDDMFVGRKDILAKINDIYQSAVAQNHTQLALVGIGGAGKSQIAIEYAYRLRPAMPQTSVFWVHASNAARFEQSYRDIADRLDLPGRMDASTDILKLVSQWLSDRTNGQWLMILDNADDDGIFFDPKSRPEGDASTGEAQPGKLPLIASIPQTENGSVIVTSRSLISAMSLVGARDNVLRVGPMDEADALELLKSRVTFEDALESGAKTLVKALEYIPLAITQAGAYIRMIEKRITISTYLQMLNESEANQATLLDKNDVKDLRRDHSSQRAVSATWQISFAQIRETLPIASDLLALMSMFDRQGIPEHLLRKKMSRLQFEDAVATWLAFSLVWEEIGQQAFEMHRLVQASMRKWLEMNDQLEKWIETSTEVMATEFPEADYKTWATCQLLLPHVRETMRYSLDKQGCLLSRATIACNTSWYLVLKGEYKEAESLIQESVENREKLLGPEHLETLVSVNNLAWVYERQGDFENAEIFHRRVLEARKKILGPENRETLESLSYLGWMLERRGRHEEAEKQGKYNEAEVMNGRALEGREKVLGPEHPQVLTSVMNMASLLKRQEKYEEAIVMYREAFRGYEKALGPEHHYTFMALSNIGAMLEIQEKYEEAETAQRQVLKGYEKILGFEHPDTRTAIGRLVSVLEKQGKHAEAEGIRRPASSN